MTYATARAILLENPSEVTIHDTIELLKVDRQTAMATLSLMTGEGLAERLFARRGRNAVWRIRDLKSQESKEPDA